MNMIDESSKQRKYGLTGAGFKIIAMLTMLIDHFAVVFFLPIVRRYGISPGMQACFESKNIYALFYMTFRLVGRIAFPIFCFFIIEGFKYTKSRLKYSVRLLIFAFISEIPFDLAFYNDLIYMKYQNVFFTLFIGLITISIVEEIRIKARFQYFIKVILNVFIMLFMSIIAEIGNTDYGMTGVLTICIMYFIMIQGNSSSSIMTAGTVLLTVSQYIEFPALINIVLIKAYNGARGKINKYIFYVFYPLHLLILYFINIKLKG